MTVRLAAVLCLTLMTGNEICVAVFVNPALRQMPENEQIPFLRRAATQLGRVMPFWYAASLLLTLATAVAEHRPEGIWPEGPLVSGAIQIVVLIITLSMMVPINNMLGRLQPGDTGWTAKAVRWDHLHQLRVLLLLAATFVFAWL